MTLYSTWRDILDRSPGIREYPHILSHSEAVADSVIALCDECRVHPLVAERAYGLAWLHDFGKAKWLAREATHGQGGPGEVELAAQALDRLALLNGPEEYTAVRNLLPYLDAGVLTSCQFISLPFEPKVVFWADLHCQGTQPVSLEGRRDYLWARYFRDSGRAEEFPEFWRQRLDFVQRFEAMREGMRLGGAGSPPEHLHLARAIGGWLYEGEPELLSRLVEETVHLPQPLCEIGSWRGRSTVCLAGSLARTGSERTLYCVDDWCGGTDADCRRLASAVRIQSEFACNTRSYADWIRPLRGLAQDVAADLPEAFSLVFLDGDHSAPAVEWECGFFGSRIVPGGILCFHDADNPAYPAIRCTINALLSKGQWEFVAQSSFMCAIRKRADTCI